MANRDRYIERDRHGRERLIIRTSPRRSSSRNRPSTRELLNDAEEQVEVLMITNEQLRAQLDIAQAQAIRAKDDLRTVTGRLQNQTEVTRELQERLHTERDRVAELEERNRLLQRTNRDSYRSRYDDAVATNAGLERALQLKDAQIVQQDRTIYDLRQTIAEYTEHLRRAGYQVRAYR